MLGPILHALICYALQALYASTSISTGMKGATKAMVAMNKVSTWALYMRTCKSSSYCFRDIGFSLAFNLLIFFPANGTGQTS